MSGKNHTLCTLDLNFLSVSSSSSSSLLRFPPKKYILFFIFISLSLVNCKRHDEKKDSEIRKFPSYFISVAVNHSMSFRSHHEKVNQSVDQAFYFNLQLFSHNSSSLRDFKTSQFQISYVNKSFDYHKHFPPFTLESIINN